MKTFEVVAREDPDEPGSFKVRAGVGCLALSIGWMLAALLGAAGMILRSCS